MVLHLYLEPTFLFNCEAGLDRTVFFERGGQLRIGGGVGKITYEEGSSSRSFSITFHCHEVKVHHVEGGVALRPARDESHTWHGVFAASFTGLARNYVSSLSFPLDLR